MGSDFRLALRLWKSRPATTQAALLTIAIGTGLNAAVFQLIWSVLLRPLPYAYPEQLVELRRVDEPAHLTFIPRDRRLPGCRPICRGRTAVRSSPARVIGAMWP